VPPADVDRRICPYCGCFLEEGRLDFLEEGRLEGDLFDADELGLDPEEDDA
jgi:hypothetical protein